MDESNQPPPRSMDRMTFQTFKFKSTSSNFALFNYSTLVTKTQVYSLGPLSIIFYYQNIGLYHYGMCHSTSITRTQVYIIRSSFTHPFITRTQVYITMTCVTQPMSLTCKYIIGAYATWVSYYIWGYCNMSSWPMLIRSTSLHLCHSSLYLLLDLISVICHQGVCQ